jgi:hypothetical protein
MMGVLAHGSFAQKRALSRHVQFERKELIMPSGISSYYSPYYMPTTSAPRGPGLLLRARVWIHDLELDAALAGGADPEQSEELALRAKQLAARKKREEMASGVSHLIEIADRHSRGPIATPYAPFRPKQVQANRSLLLKLELRLRGYKPVAVQGLALTSLMLEDGRGPLTSDSAPVTLERAVRAALSGLDPDPRRGQDPRVRIGTSS